MSDTVKSYLNMTPQEKKRRGIKLTNEELLNEYFKNDNNIKRIAKEKPRELIKLWYSQRANGMNNSEKIKWIKREITKLTGEQIKNKYFRLGNFTIKQMDPKQLRILWYRHGSDDETPEQKVLRIRTHVARGEIKNERKEKLKEYQGVYFRELYYKDLLVLSQLPYFWWRRPGDGLTENLKKNIRNSENDTERRKQKYYFPERQKINTSVEMNGHSASRIKDLLIRMDTFIFKGLQNVKFRHNWSNTNMDLFKIFSELELIKKLKTVKHMDFETYKKYDAFLIHVARYKLFIEQNRK